MKLNTEAAYLDRNRSMSQKDISVLSQRKVQNLLIFRRSQLISVEIKKKIPQKICVSLHFPLLIFLFYSLLT